MSAELFRRLPLPAILDERTFEDMFAEVRAYFENAFPDFANYVEGDPVWAALQSAAYSKLNDAKRTNDAYLQSSLAYATGTNLEVMAANVGVFRLTKKEEVLDDLGNIEEPAVLETDDQLRERACLQWAGLGIGTNLWYKRHVLAASEQVKDTLAVNNGPGNVLVWLQSESSGGGVASPELIQTVLDHLTDERNYNQNDSITVQSISVMNWNLTASLEFATGEDSTARLAEIQTAFQEWAASQEIIGKPIRVSQLYAQLSSASVVGVEITAPTADVTVTTGQVPVLQTLTLTETV